MVAQAVEQQISVRAGRVRFPGSTLAFFRQTVPILAGCWAFLLKNESWNDFELFHSSFIFLVLSVNLPNNCNHEVLKKRNKSKKRPGKAHILKLHEFGLTYEMNIFSGLPKICHSAVEVGSATLLGARARKK